MLNILRLRAALAAAAIAVTFAAAAAAQGPTPREYRRPEGTPHAVRSRTFDVKHYLVDVRFDEERRAVIGKVTVTLEPFASGFRQFTLDAVDMRVTSVTVDGRPQQFKTTRDTLEVLLDREYAALTPLSATVEYECAPKRGIYFIQPSPADPSAPRQIWSQGEMEENRYWIPSYDFPNDKATSEMVATVPSKYTVVSNGTLVGVTDVAGGLKRWHWKMDRPHASYLISIVVSEFVEIKDKWDDVPVMYYVYPGREAEGRLAFGKTPQMVAYFSERTGYKYPYPKYSQAVLHDFHFGGMENISATSQTDEALKTERERLDGTSDSLVSHELAHQWFGDLVTAKDWGNMWLNESFATFFASVWSEHDLGRDAYLLEMREDLRSYLNEDQSRYRRPVASNVYFDPIDVFDSHLYPGGAVRINLLRHVLGEELFWRGISHYLHKFEYQNVETADFKNAMEESTGRELDWFFDEWIHKAGVPEFSVSYAYDPAARQVTMHVDQLQEVTDRTPVFVTPVDVVVTTASGGQTVTVTIDKASQDVTIPAATTPLAVEFDPEGYVPKTLVFPRSRQELAYVLANGRTAVERSDAADAMTVYVRDGEAAAALARALASDRDRAVRASAAASLAEVDQAGALKALAAAASGDADAGVRRAAVQALAKLPRGAAGAALLKAYRQDQSYGVQAAALTALSQSGSSQAPALLREALASGTAHVQVRTAALQALAERKDPEAAALAVRYAQVGTPYELRLKSLELLGSAGAGSAKAYETLAKQAATEGFDLRGQAIRALGELGDARALETLRTIADDDRLDGRLRADARRAMAAIREKQDLREPQRGAGVKAGGMVSAPSQ